MPSLWTAGETPSVEGMLRMRGILTVWVMLDAEETAKVLPHEQRQEFARAFDPAALRRVVPGVFGRPLVEPAQSSRCPVAGYR